MNSAAIVLGCALQLLGRPLHQMPPIEFLPGPPAGVSPNAEAFVKRAPDTIYLITSSAVFREGRAANPACSNYQARIKLASILAHELWHLEHGPDERGAYTRQLSMLVVLGQGPGTAVFREVQGSMLAVLDAQKGRRPVGGSSGR
jgi:hypothetical protein